MSIIKVINKTNVAIDSLNLLANQEKVIYWDKTFWKKETQIRIQLGLGNIRFNDINDNEIILKNPNYEDKDTPLFINEFRLAPYFEYFNSVRTKKEIAVKEDEVSKEIREILANEFRVANPPGYNKDTMVIALDTVHFFSHLAMGFFKRAGVAINSIPDDAFFTVDRKSKLKTLCDSVDL